MAPRSGLSFLSSARNVESSHCSSAAANAEDESDLRKRNRDEALGDDGSSLIISGCSSWALNSAFYTHHRHGVYYKKSGENAEHPYMQNEERNLWSNHGEQ